MIEGDGFHCPLLSILKITVHAVLLRVAPECIHEFRVLVLLIPVHLTVWYLVDSVVGFFLSFVIDFTLVHVIEVLLPVILLVSLFCFEWLIALVLVGGVGASDPWGCLCEVISICLVFVLLLRSQTLT